MISFLSLEFILWMTVTVSLYWICPEKWRNLVLAATALAFLARWDPVSGVWLAVFTVACFAAGRQRSSRWRLLCAGALVLAVLVFYKWSSATPPNDVIRQVAVPLGLSYFALRCLHYLIEAGRGRLPVHGFSEFVGYLFFLPTLVAGPIHRFAEFHRDQRRLRWEGLRFWQGIERILYGYAKIVILGNYLVSFELARAIVEFREHSPALYQLLDCFRYGFNLYFQFSGYSDLAIGFALLLGYSVMENFNHPFVSRNISEFWRRWHISLSSWCRDYVYMSVVSKTRQRYLAILSAMIALGLWHELSWRYLGWGAYHGVGVMVWHGWRDLKRRTSFAVPAAVRPATQLCAVLTTLVFVLLSFGLTKEPTLSEGFHVYATILGGLMDSLRGGWF